MAGRKARCTCGAVIMVPAAAHSAPLPSAALTPTNALTAVCPHCGHQHTADPSLAGQQAQCHCGQVFQVPGAAAGVFEAQTAQANPFAEVADDDYHLAAEEPGMSQSTTVTSDELRSKAAPPQKNYEGAFGWEKKGWDNGVVGGLIMIAISLVWFFGGLAAGVIFYYPPILFLIGVVGLLRGIFSGNVSGR